MAEESKASEVSEVAEKLADASLEETKTPKLASTRSNVRTSDKNWNDFALKEQLISNLKNILKFDGPTQIQAESIPVIIEGKNLLAQGKNGEGKTACYILGSLNQVDTSIKKPQILCISHTRELSQQNFDIYQKFATDLGISLGHLEKGSKQSCPPTMVICGTYGLILKNIQNARKGFGSVGGIDELKVIIVDEADALFREQEKIRDMQKILASLPPNVQFLLFSATFGERIVQCCDDMIPNLEKIIIQDDTVLNLDNVTQYVIDTSNPIYDPKVHEVAAVHDSTPPDC